MTESKSIKLLSLAKLQAAKALPPGQKPDGLLLIDKPLNMTSHDVVAIVRKLSGIKKVGHAGTLDPLATGLLMLLVGREYTKRQSEFMHQPKEYTATGKLGWVSDSYDLDGQVEQVADWVAVQSVTQAELEAVLPEFTGQIAQTVPAFSAVKKNGQKLYDLARSGKLKTTELPTRQVEIQHLELTDFSLDPDTKTADFSILVRCSSGTYIRSLIHDMGQKLGVGAVVTQLRRTKNGSFKVSQAEQLPLERF